MAVFVRSAEVKVWLFLTLLTAVSFYLGAIIGGVDTARMAGALVLVVAMLKAWLVSRYFMELRHAPSSLRHVVDGWCVVTGLMLVGMFLAA